MDYLRLDDILVMSEETPPTKENQMIVCPPCLYCHETDCICFDELPIVPVPVPVESAVELFGYSFTESGLEALRQQNQSATIRQR